MYSCVVTVVPLFLHTLGTHGFEMLRGSLQVMEANSEQIERKKAMQLMEVEEDARIADYNKQKQLREADIAEEKERIAREKEAECTRLRAAQEKVADKQSELDELRARRHAEVVEREWRQRESAKAARNKVLICITWTLLLPMPTVSV